MEEIYKLALTPGQIGVLLDMVRGFVDNKKLLHIPTANGDVTGLPLTEEALVWLLDVCGQAEGKQDITVRILPADNEEAEVAVTYPANEKIFSYQVRLADFDEQ